MAVLLKITAEAHLFADQDYATPKERLALFYRLHEAARRQAIETGLKDANMWITPTASFGFVRRLGRLGWTENCWQNLSIKLR